MISADDVDSAVQQIIPYLEDTSNDALKSVYFDGWFGGLAASAVLRAIAEHPPPSLLEKFDKIIHIDCSRWTSRRALQRAIVDELNLTQQVAADFDKQDEENDFNGVEQGSRAEIAGVARVIAQSIVKYRCLVVFHNGSDGMVDLTNFGIPQPEFFNTKVLWSFRGRFRLNDQICRKVDNSNTHIFLYADAAAAVVSCSALVVEESMEIALYTHKLGIDVTPEIATECCMYLLPLNCYGSGFLDYGTLTYNGAAIDYNWATHASSYWVCDGIVQGGQDNRAWELARALQQQMRLDEYSPNRQARHLGYTLTIRTKRHWVSVKSTLQSISSYHLRDFTPRTTSLFLVLYSFSSKRFPSNKFHEAGQLRVLKLCHCSFSFSSPPFNCCPNLRFLGLDSCVDEQQPSKEEKQTGARAVQTFQRLWVLDVSHTDWELDFPAETEEPVVATDIREVHINKGRIWRSNLAWRRLSNLHKLRVVKPTSSWETGRQDEFMDMVKLELLDLSRNSTMQVLPNLSVATNLKTLVLDGCVGLEHVGPQGLPPSLESFSLDAGAGGRDNKNKARISRISLAGCARLEGFRLRGSLQELEELDLSHTAIKMLDLTDEAPVQRLGKVFLVGCKQLRSISWPDDVSMCQIRLLCIDTREGGDSLMVKKPDSSLVFQGKGNAFVAMADMRFLQSIGFLLSWKWDRFHGKKIDLCFSSTSKKDDARPSYKKKMSRPYSSTGRVAAGLPLPKPLVYHDRTTEQQITAVIDGSGSSSAMQFQPLDFHVEFGEGISDVTNPVSTKRLLEAITYMLDKVESLHVHDSSSITTVTPEHVVLQPGWGGMSFLKCLQLICEVKMLAPNLETIYIRGCWNLRHLPATDGWRRQKGRLVAVDCEKDWWDKLEWDGMEFGHHPSLFQPRHSKYYKKRHLRSTVLR
ncbi:unnamed protein product [Urochloa decumbens]|uniref:Uncharacterized protein n=1 Tax=Urochloa decumbens TaxID=240449 RepID=A0ABC9C1W5_9POAL